MTTANYCLIERHDQVLVLTMNRPERMNALPFPAHAELERAFDEFESDPKLRVAIISGAGPRAFCAGNDLKYQAEGHTWPSLPKGFAGLTSRFDLSKPVIAAVNGAAMGGGFEIALACDLIVASEDAYFALPEVSVGMAALSGGLHRLPRQIPLKHALGMLLTGRRVTAQEGLALGFVNEVVGCGQAVAAAMRWAAMIARNSPIAVRASKQAVYRGLTHASLKSAVNAPYPGIEALLRSHDYQEGPRAFKEKRAPQWADDDDSEQPFVWPCF